MLADDLISALSVNHRLVERLARHHQLAYLVGLVDPALPRFKFIGRKDTVIIEDSDRLSQIRAISVLQIHISLLSSACGRYHYLNTCQSNT